MNVKGTLGTHVSLREKGGILNNIRRTILPINDK
jgi:hypothetical protein